MYLESDRMKLKRTMTEIMLVFWGWTLMGCVILCVSYLIYKEEGEIPYTQIAFGVGFIVNGILMTISKKCNNFISCFNLSGLGSRDDH